MSSIFTGQQADLGPTFLKEFKMPVTERLNVMQPGQNLSSLMASLFTALEPTMNQNTPDAVVVQGDTCSALAGAMVAHFHKIPIFHVEAGLRTFDSERPFPEEMNRSLIARLAHHHFAATDGNRNNLIREGIEEERISVTGNTIVDVVLSALKEHKHSQKVEDILSEVSTPRLIVLTAHRRENFDELMPAYCQVIREFIDSHPNFSVVVPIHPNPVAGDIVENFLLKQERVIALEPLAYFDFLAMMHRADLVVSDSGGIQEEVVSLNRPLFILREKTERPEAIESGYAKLAPSAKALAELLEEFALATNTFNIGNTNNPFGDGNASPRIAQTIVRWLSKPR